MNIYSLIKKFKPAHWFYNLFHYKSLRHNKQAFKKYNVQKPLFASISSKDFPDKKSRAWLDIEESKDVAALHPAFNSFTPAVKEQIINWSDNGFILLPNFFDDDSISSINKEIDRIIESNLIKPTHDNKLPFANRISTIIKQITYDEGLCKILNFLL